MGASSEMNKNGRSKSLPAGFKWLQARCNALRNEREGSVAIIGAIAFVAVILTCALAIEASSLYLHKLQVQRVTDMANLAAANTPGAIVDHQPSPMALATARQVAAINGLGGSNIVTTVTQSKTGSDDLTTNIVENVPYLMGSILSNNNSADVSGTSSASPQATAEGDCIRSMTGPVNIYDNAVVDGPNCKISAATYLYVCGQANVNASDAAVKYTRPSEKPYICPTATMKPTLDGFAFSEVSVDPLIADTRILAIKKRLKAMSSWPYSTTIPAPLNPNTPRGADKAYLATTASLAGNVAYGNLVVVDSVLNFTGNGADPTCRNPTTISGNIVISGNSHLIFGAGCYAVGGYVTIANGSNVSFETLNGAQVTLALKQYLQNGAATTSFSPMTFSIKGSVYNTLNGVLTFGSGPFYFGGGVVNGTNSLSFGDGPFYFSGGSISNGTGTLSFGSGGFYLWGGSMSNATTGTIQIGNGPFYFYGGTVTNVAGTMTLGNGNAEFYGGSLALNPGSTTTFGVGNIDFYGGTAYLNGAKTVIGGDGDMQNGSSSVFFYGGSYTISTQALVAKGTTFGIWGGSFSLLGVGTMNMTAPTSANPNYGYQNILLYIYGGAFSLYQGQVTDTMSGIIYVPGTNVSIYGKQTIKIPQSGCFQIIGGVVDIYQFASASFSSCLGSNGINASIHISQ